jgi:hypothetical protein
MASGGLGDFDLLFEMLDALLQMLVLFVGESEAVCIMGFAASTIFRGVVQSTGVAFAEIVENTLVGLALVVKCKFPGLLGSS